MTGVGPRSLAAIALIAASGFVPVAWAAPDAEKGKALAEPCFACHGADGNSSNALFPSLAGQTPLYIYYQLIQFREERRKDPLMSPFAAKLTDAQMRDIAAFYSAQPPKGTGQPADEAKVKAGAEIGAKMHCNSCHMPNYQGQQHVPRLAGLQHDYLVKQLKGFKTGARPDIDGTMASAAQPLTDADIENVSAYLSGLR